MGNRTGDPESSGDRAMSNDKKETIIQRRNRVLGTRSLRYVDSSVHTSSAKEVTPAAGRNKRRSQIVQAQRAHRQRTFDYIAELESEVFRLRDSAASLSATLKVQQDNHTHQLSGVDTRAQDTNIISIRVLIQCLNGQIAPGLWLTPERLSEIESKLPVDMLPSPLLLDSCEDISLGDRFCILMEPIWNQATISPGLESHDAMTRALFLNFSENIAPTLVAFDGLSNGYRSLLLPLAWEDDLVRLALLASSANHLRFRRPKLTNLALSFQSATIEKLTSNSNPGSCSSDSRPAILAAIILLLINGMMSGGSDFELLLNMAKSWIEAIKTKGSLTKAPNSALDEFLLDQVNMMQIYAQPLLKEQLIILSQHECYSPDLSAGNFSFGSRMYQIFASLEDAIKQACVIYSYHITNDDPPTNVDDLLEVLKSTVESIPNHTPGENALAWVYFIAAAESRPSAKRTFFAKRLMGIFERGSFSDITTAFTVLHQIWSFQGMGSRWTEVLLQMPLVLK